MGLDDFIESGDKTYHTNGKLDKKKLHKDSICPECGNGGEHVRGNEYRCNNDCDVLYYFATNPITNA